MIIKPIDNLFDVFCELKRLIKKIGYYIKLRKIMS